ncbi:ATP-dependent DNA helicase 2 subunit 1 [Cydia fagiglandana]|uniref:ATP-dependent DNA helicase 2 subunit 1 n=1 Tax=Cydia fagiglandana TaxID=1458189 RepID=UPI002FEE4D28
MDSDEEIDNAPSWRGVPGCIVLINIYDPSKYGTAKVAHAATCSLIRQNLKFANSNHIGVCLYGTEDSNSSAFGIKSVVDVCPLNTPSLEDFKKLRSLEIKTLKQAKEFKMSDVLWHCSKMFANCKKLLSSRTVLILSRLDEPPIASDQKPTIKRVNDLVDSNIEVKFVNISQLEYKIDKFYKNFLFEASKGKGVIIPKIVWECKEVEELMYQQTDRHLAVAKLSFEIGDGLSIGVGVYNLSKTHQYQKTTALHRADNAILTSVTKTVKVTQRPDNSEAMDVDGDGTVQMPLLKSELLYYQEYGGERVEFTDNEMKSLKNPFGPPMMKLLGFKPSHVLCKEKWFLKPCQFLFPNESIIEGSTVAFKALHQACLEMSMVAICVLSTRVNSKPKIVALSPCSNPLGNDVEMGFDVIQLPFMENVREVPIINDDEDREVSRVDKSFMKDVLNTVRCDYHPKMFENPKTQALMRAVEAVALEEDAVEPFEDTTKPKPKVFEDVKADLFEEIFGPFDPQATKRYGPSSSGPAAKKARLEGMDAEAILNHRLRNKEVQDYTVKELRELLKSKNTPALTGMKKTELVDLVYQFYSDD